MPWLTPTSIPTGRICVTMEVPNSSPWRQAVIGALLELTYRRNWEEVGVTPQQAADVMLECFNTHHMGGCMFSGLVVAFAGDTAPAGWLVCDGEEYDAEDYPGLFAAIGYTWGGSDGVFNVPDLRGRSIIGAGQGSGLTSRTLGSINGEETHALSTAELPVHYHTYKFSPADVAYGTDGEASNFPGGPYSANTQATGSGTAHNNMPPWAALNWIIAT